MRQAVVLLANRTGWQLSELLALPLDDVFSWLDACNTAGIQ